MSPRGAHGTVKPREGLGQPSGPGEGDGEEERREQSRACRGRPTPPQTHTYRFPRGSWDPGGPSEPDGTLWRRKTLSLSSEAWGHPQGTQVHLERPSQELPSNAHISTPLGSPGLSPSPHLPRLPHPMPAIPLDPQKPSQALVWGTIQ